MFKSSYTIARVFGVPINVDLSLVVLALLLWYQIGNLVLGLVAAVLLMLSVTLHELGHTWVALRFGCRVRDITLMLIGGRATLLDMPRQPWKEFLVAVAGPLVSLGLWLGGSFGGHFFLTSNRESMPGAVLYWLGEINKWLLLFNLLPAFPMDGGRVLRALLAQRLGRLQATFIASRVGRVLAIAMGLYAVYRSRWVLLLIAIFIYQAAEQEYRMVQREELGGVDPWRIFRGGPPPVPEDRDQVVVSPPPYRRDRAEHRDLHTEE